MDTRMQWRNQRSRFSWAGNKGVANNSGAKKTDCVRMLTESPSKIADRYIFHRRCSLRPRYANIKANATKAAALSSLIDEQQKVKNPGSEGWINRNRC
jgi:hypothetical protein